MSFGNAGGRPTKFTPELTEMIIDAIDKVIVLKHVAGLCEIHVTSLYNWLEQGKQDVIAGNWTDHAQFFYAVKGAQGKKIRQMLDKIAAGSKNWQAQAWILERCFRDEFGVDAGVIQELLAKCEKLENDFKRMNDNQGVINHG